MRITATFEQLTEDGERIASYALKAAIRSIDEQFGPGYAAKHPELVATFMDIANRSYLQMAAEKMEQYNQLHLCPECASTNCDTLIVGDTQ